MWQKNPTIGSGQQAFSALVFIGIGIFAYIYFTGSSDENSKIANNETKILPKSSWEHTIGNVDAMTLYKDYSSNEVSADAKYKGNKYLVEGVVDAIEKDFTDSIVIRLRTNNEFSPVMANLISSNVESKRLPNFHVAAK